MSEFREIAQREQEAQYLAQTCGETAPTIKKPLESRENRYAQAERKIDNQKNTAQGVGQSVVPSLYHGLTFLILAPGVRATALSPQSLFH